MEIKCDHCNFRKGTHRIGQNFYCQECFDEYNQSYSEAFPDDPEAAKCVHCNNTFTRNCLMNIDGDVHASTAAANTPKYSWRTTTKTPNTVPDVAGKTTGPTW